MLSFYHFLGQVLEHPSDRLERLTPWIVTVIGGSMLALMLYAWWTAPSF